MRSHAMLAALFGSALVLSPLGCAMPGEGPPAPRDGVFVHVHSGPSDAHRALMGLFMAKVMADDRDVLVYVDIDGIGLLTKDAPDLALEPFGTSGDLLRELLDRDVPVYACPSCLKVAGRTKDDLLPGVQVADKEAFFAFTQGRILSIDY